MLVVDPIEHEPDDSSIGPAPTPGGMPLRRPAPSRPAAVEPNGSPKRRNRVLWFVTAAAFVQYVVVGWWLLVVRGYFISDALSRTLAARFMVSSRDPHLGSVGFYWMPLPTVSRIPFVLLMEPFDRVELAGPMTSALFAALTIPVIVGIGRTLGVARWGNVIAAIYALSPVTMYMGGNGMSESTLGFFFTLTLWAYLRWRHDGRIQSLAMLGIALGGAMTTRYETLVLIPVVAVAVAVASDKERRTSAAVLATLPAIVAFAVWALASYLIMDDPLFWYHEAKATTARPEGAPWMPDTIDAGSIATYVLFIVFSLAPALVAVVAGCVVSFRRWRTSIGVLGVIFAVPFVVAVQTLGGSSWGIPRFFVLAPVVATVGVLWVLRSGRTNRATRMIGIAGVALLVLGSLSGSLLLSSQRWAHAEGEHAFFGPLLGRSSTNVPVDDSLPATVFTGHLDYYRDPTIELDKRLALGEMAAMDSLQAFPYLFSKHPDQYIVPEDRDFEEILSDPVGRFNYIVVLPGASKTAYRLLLDAELQRREGDDGQLVGSWEMVADSFGRVQIFEWVPVGEEPRFGTDRPAADVLSSGS